MATFLFDKTVFGPVNSRRLGISLGINLLPNNGKICSFDCVYCECGLNKDGKTYQPQLPPRNKVAKELEYKLQEMTTSNALPNVITFAGNGEPTMHPEFSNIIDDTIHLRNKYAPKSNVSVLSNSMHLLKPGVSEALKKVDQSILKLDSAIQKTFELINRPQHKVSVRQIVQNLSDYKGKTIIQTLFCHGTINDIAFNNASSEELEAYLNALKKIEPQKVMIYTYSRDTPFQTLEKTPISTLQFIAKKVSSLGIEAEVTS